MDRNKLEQAAAVQEVTDYVIYLIDPHGVVQFWNKGAELIKGYSPEEVRGKHFSIFYTPEAIAAGIPDREIRRAAETGRAEDEDWRVRKDGSRFWANEVITALHDESGRVAGFAKITRDMTARKRMEDALRESEQRYRSVVEGVRDYAIFSMSADLRITNWNKAAEGIIGYTETEIMGQRSDVIFTPEDRAAGAPDDEARRARETGRALNERWHLRKDGSLFWGEGVLTSNRNELGEVSGFFKLLRDNTAQKRLEDERERLLEGERAARAEAETATRLKEDFLAVVSHELRTPIAAILLWVKLLRAGMLNERARNEAAEVIEHSAKAQQQLIEDLLDVSRILSGKMRLALRPTDLAALAESAVEAVRPMAEARAVDLDVRLDPGLGVARIDPDRIQQVLWNLLTNAVKFTQADGRIELELRRLERELYIRVSDNGKGISPEFLPHVFERFRQADASTTRLESGLGLGMAITKQLVELHGGTIVAESPGEGSGATFVIRLPLRVMGGARPGHRAPRDEKVFSPSSVLKGVWVLLVEDDDPTRRAVTWLLEQSGAEVTAVPSTHDALHALSADMRGRRPDVLISDIAMPGQDGFELIRRVREVEVQRGKPPMAAIALTAYSSARDERTQRHPGFHLLLEKPVEPADLIDAIRSLLHPA